MNRIAAHQLTMQVREELNKRLDIYIGATWSETLREEIRELAKEILRKYAPAKAVKTITALVSIDREGTIDVRFMDHKGRIS